MKESERADNSSCLGGGKPGWRDQEGGRLFNHIAFWNIGTDKLFFHLNSNENN